MPWPTNRRVMGTKVQRLDGPDKATGRAKYSYDINRPGMLHAKILRCPHAHATVQAINTAACEKTPGFRAFYIIRDVNQELTYAGAEVIAVCADTEEHADDCLRAIRVDYAVLPFRVKEEDALRDQNQPSTVGGNSNVGPPQTFETANFANAAFQGATVVENNYGLPVICHQCLESRGLVAEWDAKLENLTVWCSTQAVPNTAAGLAMGLNIAPARVRCITEYMGGGFGSKFGPETHGIAAAQLARKARAPVKLMLDRSEEVSTGGMRPSIAGTVKIGGTANGTIQGFEVDCYGSPGVGQGATVNFNLLPYIYPVPNVKRRHRVIRLNAQTAKAMRAPGHPQNSYLTDSAVDDLAARLNLNPMQVRLQNLPANDPNAVRNAPNSLLAIRNTVYTRQIEIARRLSDWNNKWHPPGRGEAGPIKRGIGMGLHTWGGGGGASNDVRVTISNDGSVLVTCATQDLGTGARTVLAIVVAEVLGLEPRDIIVRVGDSTYGRSTPSGGSTTTPGISPAAYNAATAAATALFAAIAPRINAQPGDLQIEPGRIVNRTNQQAMPWRQACARLGMETITGDGNWLQGQGLSDQGVCGVQVAEVRVDTETGVVSMVKFVAVQDCGLIVNKLACESQLAGGVIMGINYALYEERIMDRVTGRQVNPNMEFYKLAGINDIPPIILHMMDMPERGVIGIGEPATVSTAAVVGNAVFNALGVRVGNGPFTPDRVLAALAAKAPRNGGGN